MTLVKRVLHWLFEHPAHRHHYALHVERDVEGNVKPYWQCIFVLCDDKIEVTEWT